VVTSAEGALADRHLNQLYRRALAKPPEVCSGDNNVAAQVQPLLASPSVAMQDKPPDMQPIPVALELEGSEIPSETVTEPSVPPEQGYNAPSVPVNIPELRRSSRTKTSTMKSKCSDYDFN
jgi:hypothetical protein